MVTLQTLGNTYYLSQGPKYLQREHSGMESALGTKGLIFLLDPQPVICVSFYCLTSQSEPWFYLGKIRLLITCYKTGLV